MWTQTRLFKIYRSAEYFGIRIQSWFSAREALFRSNVASHVQATTLYKNRRMGKFKF